MIARSLRLDNVRIVVAGLEAAAMPGQDYYPNGPQDGALGLMVDFIRGFSRNDVIAAIELASRAAGADLGDAGAGVLADQAIQELPANNQIISASLSAEVAARLSGPIRSMFEERSSG